MKTDLLLRQTRIHFPRFDVDEVKITPIEKGGSDRRFYRVKSSPDQTLILVKYNLEREENRHYVQIAEFLAAHSIRAPKIYFHDVAEGLIWIEDLGEEDLFAHRGESWLVRRALYESALDEVAKLHRLPEEVCVSVKDSLPAEFNAALYRWEQNYFFENCLGRVYKINNDKIDMLAALPALNEIAERLDQSPRVLVHRDFQSQNIIVRNGQAHLIDFQGMRPGLAQYDLASLLYDPYVDLSEAERAELISHYCGGKPSADFEETLRVCAMQRLMQALGAYGFLGLVKEHKDFLQYIPAALTSLREIVAKIDNLDPLAQALTELA
ncbi:MAG: phosphotransferase [Spartobacteria bacterium]